MQQEALKVPVGGITIVIDPVSGGMGWALGQNIDIARMVNALEVLKQMLVQDELAAIKKQQVGIMPAPPGLHI